MALGRTLLAALAAVPLVAGHPARKIFARLLLLLLCAK